MVPERNYYSDRDRYFIKINFRTIIGLESNRRVRDLVILVQCPISSPFDGNKNGIKIWKVGKGRQFPSPEEGAEKEEPSST